MILLYKGYIIPYEMQNKTDRTQTPAGFLSGSLTSPLPQADGRDASALVLPHGTMAQEVARWTARSLPHDLTSLIPYETATRPTPVTVALDAALQQGTAQGRRTERSAAGCRTEGAVRVSVTG